VGDRVTPEAPRVAQTLGEDLGRLGRVADVRVVVGHGVAGAGGRRDDAQDRAQGLVHVLGVPASAAAAVANGEVERPVVGDVDPATLVAGAGFGDVEHLPHRVGVGGAVVADGVGHEVG